MVGEGNTEGKKQEPAGAGTPLTIALSYLRAGLSVIPVRADGSKAPPVAWTPYQQHLPTEAELQRWFADGRHGMALVCGEVSGNLETVDFDREAEMIFPDWSALVEAEAPALIARLSVARTPNRGFHVRYRCPEVVIPGNSKLAKDPLAPRGKDTLIETRGEGGYALAPGCPPACHETGRTYDHHSGPELPHVQTITAADREILMRCARSFDRSIYDLHRWDAGDFPRHCNGKLTPGDDFNQRGLDWSDILTGWTAVRQRGKVRYWRRPGKDGPGWSATTGACTSQSGCELFYVFSSNGAPFEAGRAYSKFAAYTLLHHRGDFKRAAAELARQGYGGPARRDGPADGVPAIAAPDTSAGTGELGILLSTVQAEHVAWLWPARIPLAKLTILDGDPGLGKSVLSLDLAARVTTGQVMPGVHREPGEDCEPAGVVLLTAEDGLADTVVPRLMAAGADRTRVLALDHVGEGAERRLPAFPLDAGYVREAARRIGARLIVVDPLTAYLGPEINAHRDSDCRRALYPLALLAEQTGAAVVVVRHLNKGGSSNPLYRGGGSIGIIGAARSGLLVAKDPDNPDRRILASTKCNLAKLPVSLAYDLSTADNGALRIGWMGDSPHTAESLLAASRDDEDRDAVQEAVEVLRAILENGPVPSEEAKKDARKAGVADRTLIRAKSILGVKSRKVGFTGKGAWLWSLPGQNP
jgi:hypothetical protein